MKMKILLIGKQYSMKYQITTLLAFCISMVINSQNIIPIDTAHWDIQARSYVIETYKGQKAIYLQGGGMRWKNNKFKNGTIEYDIHLKKVQAFPGVSFRVDENFNGEEFYVRPHLPGKPDANQVAPITHGITPWQLYFGPKYSFPYEYTYDDWTHVKIVVNEGRAQVFLDHATKPNLSWNLFHDPKAGDLGLRGGNQTGMHIANISINPEATQLKDFNPIERKPIDGLVSTWSISDRFEESELQNSNKIKKLIESRQWKYSVSVEEGTAANISRKASLLKNRKKNTVFAKLEFNSDRKQTKLFHFGYSDRVVVILNGKPMYWGTNRWRSRDYRYLGTVGLFDAVYLNLKKGKNTLYLAISEDFGGWLVTGKFNNKEGLEF